MAAIWGMPWAEMRGIVTKDAAEIVLIRKDFILQGQEHTGRINQIDEGKMILQRNTLGPQDLLDGGGKEGTRFDGGIVCDDHEVAVLNLPNAGDDTSGSSSAPLFIHLKGRKQRQLKEGAPGIDEPFNALTSRQAAFFMLPFDGCLTTAQPDLLLGRPDQIQDLFPGLALIHSLSCHD